MRVSTAERRAIINTRIASTFPSRALDPVDALTAPGLPSPDQQPDLRLALPVAGLAVGPVHFDDSDPFALQIPGRRPRTSRCPQHQPGPARHASEARRSWR
jgi:hypothetical protein